jgi:hypothetical protein
MVVCFPKLCNKNAKAHGATTLKDPLSQQQQRSKNNKSLFHVIKNIFISVYFILFIHCVLLIQ